MPDVKLNWAQASVRDSKLTVPFEGEPDKDWEERFQNTIRLLGGGDRGEVQVEKQEVRVAGVSPGGEEKLHHYLESVIEQANAVERAETERPADGDERKHEGPDADMTDRFRAFAEPDDGEEE